MIPQLSSSQRRAFRAAAHSLNPVVSIAQQGVSPSVLAEIDRCLNAHELIKVRVYGEDRDIREALMQQVCESLNAAPVQHIGNVLVIWRQKPDAPAEKPKAPRATGRVRKAERVDGKVPASGLKVRAKAAPKPRTSRAAAPRRAATGKGRSGR